MAKGPRNSSDRRRVGWVSGSALAVALMLLYAPIAQLLVSSANENTLTARWTGFTTQWYRLAFDNDAVISAAGRSARLAILVGLSAGSIGSVAALVVRRHPRFQAAVLALATARIATPELVLAVALGVVFPLAGVRFSTWTMWFGHTALLSGYVVVVVSTRLGGLDRLLEESAADLGASPLRVVRHIVLPHVAPAMVSAGLLVAAFSFDDVLMSARLGGPNDTTLPLVILSMATRRPTPQLDAIGTLVVAAGALTFIMALVIGRIRSANAADLIGASRATNGLRAERQIAPPAPEPIR